MTKFNNLKGKRVKSNLKHTESKLVKKRTTLKGRNTKKATIIEVSRVMPFCVLPLCILHFCVLPFWVLPLRDAFLRVGSLRDASLRVAF